MTGEFRRLPEENLARKILDVTGSVTNPAVDPGFRLVRPDASTNPPMQEFVSENLGGRFIGLASDDPIAYRHAALLEAHLPVLSSIYPPNGLLLLQVPSGARPVTGYVNSLRANHRSYASAFRAIGSVCGALEMWNFGTPATSRDEPLLGQFALAPDPTSDDGEKLYYLPPYNLEERQPRQRVLAALRAELTFTGLSPNQVAFLGEQADMGWSDVNY